MENTNGLKAVRELFAFPFRDPEWKSKFLTHVAVQRMFGAFFEVGKWFGLLRANLGGYVVILVLLAALYMVMMFSFQILYFTVILCLFWPVVVAPLGFYATLLLYHLSGLAYGEARS
jgi:hypothetical protein